MTSVRKQVFEYMNIYPHKSLKEVKKHFRDCPGNTIGTYYRDYNRIHNNIRNDTLDIRTELQKIIKDYKQPASARVQAIREYNNLNEKQPDKSGEDPYLKFLEKQNLKTKTITDISLTASTSPTKGKTGSTDIKTLSSDS